MPEPIVPEVKEEEVKTEVKEIKDPQAVYDLAQKTIEEKRIMRAKLSEMETELESFKNIKLEEEKKFKELADEYRKKYEAEKEVNTNFQTSLVEAKKKQSLVSQLEKLGVKADRKDTLLKLANLESIKYDDEYKLALGFEEEATRLKTMLPECFGTNGIGTSSDSPDMTHSNVDLDAWKKMNPADQKKHYNEVRKKLYGNQ